MWCCLNQLFPEAVSSLVLNWPGKTHLRALLKLKMTGIQPCRDFDLTGSSGLKNLNFS